MVLIPDDIRRDGLFRLGLALKLLAVVVLVPAIQQKWFTTFLVDTFESLDGVKNAIRVGERLRRMGKRLLGVRLDSGDLGWLSVEARKLLDAAGFNDAVIIGSNDLDEHVIESLRHQGAAISVWGVGTRLVTAFDDPALGGVYKLSMVTRAGRPPAPCIKLSDQASKTSIPGVQQVRRFARDGKWVADAIYDERTGCAAPTEIVDPVDPTRRRWVGPDLHHEDLLVPVVRRGRAVGKPPALDAIRQRVQSQIGALDPTVRRLMNPHSYPVGLTRDLYEERLRLIESARNPRSSRDPASGTKAIKLNSSNDASSRR